MKSVPVALVVKLVAFAMCLTIPKSARVVRCYIAGIKQFRMVFKQIDLNSSLTDLSKWRHFVWIRRNRTPLKISTWPS